MATASTPPMSPLFSVIIPLYNRASIIEKTIQSVLEQTCQDFEIIVVDDGSQDNSAEVMQQLQSHDRRIRYLQQPNSGAPVARNKGIDAATGKYVALLDSDDLFLRHHLEATRQVLSEKPEAVVYARIIVDRGNNTNFMKPPRALQPGEHMSEYLMCHGGFVQTSTLVLPTNLARKVRYLEGLRFGQDTDFALRLFAVGASFQMIHEPGVIWSDVADAKRVSTHSSGEQRLQWLNSVRGIITDKAYYADRGWFVARALIHNGHFLKGAGYYLSAVLHRAYRPAHALRVLLQLAFPRSLYRTLANQYIAAKK